MRDLLRPDPRYVIDASSLIELRDTYPVELAPGAWSLVDRLIEEHALVSAEDVFEELAVGDDLLLDWAKAHKDIFVPLTTDIQHVARAVLADFPDLIDTKKRKGSADPFVIATAQIMNATVVTEEDFVGPGNRPRIPNVCRARSVPCIDLKKMFLREKLVLIAAEPK